MIRRPSWVLLLFVACQCAEPFRATSISLAGTEACAIVERTETDDGGEPAARALPEVQCWGGGRERLEPVDVGLPLVSVEIGDPSCGIDLRGMLACWGDNARGQLGDGTFDPSPIALPVLALPAIDDFEVARFPRDGGFACALSSGEVFCWGAGTRGQLGTGELVDREFPVAIPLLSGVTQLSLGGAHACAVLTGGAVVCWGANDVGQVGDGALDDRLVPEPVLGLSSGVVQVALGVDHSCALHEDGGITCWGGSAHGQAGALLEAVLIPRRVDGAEGFDSLVSGASHLCGTLASGGVACWGANDTMQAGSANILPQLRPTPVAVPATALSAGRANTCALLATGGVRCWGAVRTGILGLPDGDDSAIPLQVPGFP
ncbi:MAG: hypothetical protein KF901_26575 [Myxococcales bacterium]|nr:hypothetical protein [Myxococcales bacterium]